MSDSVKTIRKLSRPSKQSETNWANKLKALSYYGSECQCCGETEPVFLTFDHVYGGGNAHRKRDRQVKNALGTWLVRESFPDGFRVLCFNCHHAIDTGPKHLQGRCPHQTSVPTLEYYNKRDRAILAMSPKNFPQGLENTDVKSL